MPALSLRRHNLLVHSVRASGLFSLPYASLCLESRSCTESWIVMMTQLVDIEDAKPRLACGERPYGFQISGNITLLGPACGFGADYLSKLRTEGCYAETLDEAAQIAKKLGVSISGIWFVKI